MSNEFVLYYESDGKISQVSPMIEDNPLSHIMISEEMGIGFCTGALLMRDYVIDLPRNSPELTLKIRKKLKARNNFYLIPHTTADKEIALTYDRKNKELKIELSTISKTYKVFFITAKNNPIKLLQSVTIEADVAEKTVNIQTYPFSVFTWEEETMGYKEIN